VIRDYEAVKTEGIARNRSVNGASSSGIIGLKGLAVASSTDFVLLSTPDKVVSVGIERKQYSEVSVGIYVEDQQVPVVAGTNLDLGTISGKKSAIIVDPQSNRWVVLVRGHGSGTNTDQQWN
jgi:hypothetical protein